MRAAEVTRFVREMVVVTPVPISEPIVNVTQGITLQVSRSQHTATRLLDGRILLVGGSKGPDEHLADVEIFDPVSGRISKVASLHTPRHGHTSTLLPDGRVLVSGGARDWDCCWTDMIRKAGIIPSKTLLPGKPYDAGSGFG